MTAPSAAVSAALAARRRHAQQWTANRVARWTTGVVFLVAVGFAWQLAQVDLARLFTGLPKVMHWLAQGWPPATAELPIFILRMAETVAIALLGTLGATALAVPVAVIAARGVTPLPWIRLPLRWLLNAFRGIDSFVFALVLVAAVGLGPFAGVLGVILHTWGSAGKLLADQIETMPMATMEALEVGGAGRLVAFRYAMVPDLLPSWASISLYLFEFNVRASTVLGVVGAGGIGQELKSSMDLLDFARLATIIAVILVTVTLIDTLAAWTRRRLK